MEAQKDFNQYLKQHDQYLAKTRKEETSKFLAEKRSKFTESASENDAIVNVKSIGLTFLFIDLPFSCKNPPIGWRLLYFRR